MAAWYNTRMSYYLMLLVGAVLVNNFVLNRFLGCCPFLGVSKKMDTALGMSGAVVFVMTIAAAMKRPRAVMWGQIAYTVSLFAVCAALLPLGCPGWAIAISAIFVAPMCVTAVVYAALGASRDKINVCFG